MKDLSKLTDDELEQYRRTLEYEVSKYRTIQEAIKTSINSAYGICGNNYFRYFNVNLAEAVTKSGQFVIRSLINSINECLNKLLKTENEDYIIGGDTDSLFISYGKIVDKYFDKEAQKNADKIIKFMDVSCEKVLQPVITSVCENIKEYFNAPVNALKMKRESLAGSAVYMAKKRYAMSVRDKEGVPFNPPKIIIKGVEAIRSSTPEVCRDKIKECIKLILHDSEETVQKFISEFKKDFLKLSPEQIAEPRTCNGVIKYANQTSIYAKGTPEHVRAALLYNHKIKDKKLTSQYDLIKEGDKIKFIHLKKPNPIFEDVIGFSDILPKELELEEYVDYEEQFQKTFLDPVERILDVMGWKSKKELNLSCFFDD